MALLAAIGAVGCAAVAYGASTQQTLEAPTRAAVGAAVPPHAATTVRPERLRQLTRRWTGIRIERATVAVAVRVSPSYGDTEEVARRWGEFLLRLIHGEELDGVTLYLATEGEVAALCGINASGCYGSGESDIVSIGDDSTGVRPEAIVAHEYGHFIAANRDNAPWRALDWGTKRWATLIGVCAGVRAKKMFPADQVWRYELNPGEGFAEAYRVLNQQSVAGGAMDWPIVHKKFFPTEIALEAIRRDVLEPWTTATEVRLAGRIGPGGRARVLVPTPLDGRLELNVQGATAPARVLVCGTRKTAVNLVGKPGARFSLTATRP